MGGSDSRTQTELIPLDGGPSRRTFDMAHGRWLFTMLYYGRWWSVSRSRRGTWKVTQVMNELMKYDKFMLMNFYWFICRNGWNDFPFYTGRIIAQSRWDNKPPGQWQQILNQGWPWDALVCQLIVNNCIDGIVDQNDCQHDCTARKRCQELHFLKRWATP